MNRLNDPRLQTLIEWTEKKDPYLSVTGLSGTALIYFFAETLAQSQQALPGHSTRQERSPQCIQGASFFSGRSGCLRRGFPFHSLSSFPSLRHVASHGSQSPERPHCRQNQSSLSAHLRKGHGGHHLSRSHLFQSPPQGISSGISRIPGSGRGSRPGST